MSSSSPGSSTTRTSSPASITVSVLRDEAAALAQHGDDQAAVGHDHVSDLLTGHGRVLVDDQLDDLEPVAGQVEQVHEPVLGHLVLDQAQDQVRRRHRRLDPQLLEVVEVAGVVDAGHDPLDLVLVARHLADEDVVLVVAGDRDHEVGALDAGALEHPQLAGVAVLHGVLELLLDHQVAAAVVLQQGHLVALVDQLPCQVPADLPGPGDDHVHERLLMSRPRPPPACSIATAVGQIVWRPCSRYHSARRGSSTRTITFSMP